MADTQDLQATLRALRTRIDELERRRRRSVDEPRFAILGTALAVASVALTATTWVVDEDGDEPWTLWGLAAEGWQGFVLLALVVGVALTTPALFLTEHPSRAGHLVMVWVALLTAAWVLVLNAVVPDDADTAPGRWLTLLTMLAIAAAHGFRAEELNDSRPALRRHDT